MGFSWMIALCLLAVLAMSSAVFWALVHRWTVDRSRAAVSEWAKERGFVRHREPRDLPLPTGEPLRPIVDLASDRMMLLQLENTAAPASQWNVLIATIDSPWKPTALRPTNAARSFLDLVSLSSYPLMGETDRFVIFGIDTASARRLSKSHARALLPPDIGLLLHGDQLILDFSSRPFDTIEFGRMIALAEQLIAQLPGAAAAAPAR
jgi:hypothetical protein